MNDEKESILVGFEGYTDSNGDVATIQPLFLQKKWEEIDSGACENFWKRKFEYYVPRSLWCEKQRKKLNIADNSNKDQYKPPDYLNLIWKPKVDERDPDCFKKDFLRHTTLGWWVMTFQVIRP